MLFIMRHDCQVRTADEIDAVVSTCIPDPDTHPELHNIVTTTMMHGPCGTGTDSPCMADGKCTKRYPRDFSETTTVGTDAYPVYKRPSDGREVVVKGKTLNNRHVVPYNAYLSLMFNCHINVEICSSLKAIKYLHK